MVERNGPNMLVKNKFMSSMTGEIPEKHMISIRAWLAAKVA